MIKRKRLFWFLGLIFFIYFSLPIIDEYIYSLDLISVDLKVFNLSTIPYFTLQYLLYGSVLVFIGQYFIFIIFWIAVYAVIDSLWNLIKKRK